MVEDGTSHRTEEDRLNTEGKPNVEAVILAGAVNDGRLKDLSGEKYEALVPLAGKCMVQYVVDALQKAETIDGISVVGFPEFRERLSLKEARLVPAGKSFLDSVRMGLEVNSAAEHLFFITGDVPMITGPVIDRFVQSSIEGEGEFFVPVVMRETSEARFPGVSRTYVKLRDGDVTLGNCFFGTEHSIRRVLPELEKMYHYRKSPLRMASTLGPGFIMRLLTRRAGIAHLEQMFQRVTGAEGHAVISPDPELAADVDKPEQLLTLEQFLREEVPPQGGGLP